MARAAPIAKPLAEAPPATPNRERPPEPRPYEASNDELMEFYRQMLPDWSRNLADARGKELIRDEKDCVLLIRITSQRDRTLIETGIKPSGYPNLFERGIPLENRVLPTMEQ